MIKEETMDQLNDFLAKEMEERRVSPEMGELQEQSFDLLKTMAKVETLRQTYEGLKALGDEDAELFKDILEKSSKLQDEKNAALAESVKGFSKAENKDDFIKVAKMTRFTTSNKKLDAGTFTIKGEEVSRRLSEETNEMILRSNGDVLADMLSDVKNDKVQRFVGMFKKRSIPFEVEAWIDEHISDQTYNLRIKEQFEEMKSEIFTEMTLKSTATRWIGMSNKVKEEKQVLTKLVEELMTIFKKELTLL